MKKMFGALLLSSLLAVGCTSVAPLCATGNTLGSKVGTATAKYLFGALPMGGADGSIATAAQNGGITKISTVDVKTELGFIFTNVTTVVTGE